MLKIELPLDEIAALCRKWKVTELAVFGSALRDDFGPDSDIDMLVSFQPGAVEDYFTFFKLRDELQALIQRPEKWTPKTGHGDRCNPAVI
jgi:predicted nucleotidyltransferase